MGFPSPWKRRGGGVVLHPLSIDRVEHTVSRSRGAASTAIAGETATARHPNPAPLNPELGLHLYTRTPLITKSFVID